jgi:hypothetical protein
MLIKYCMKKICFALFCVLFLVYFLGNPSGAIAASSRGLTLWFTQILPTLLPFSVLSYVVLASGLLSCRKRGISREGYVLLCGFLFGFPIGSKLAADLYREGELSRRHAMILCCFANNLSPAYVTAALGEILALPVRGRYYLLLYGIPLLLCTVCLLTGEKTEAVHKKSASGFRLDMQIVDAGIINGFETLIKICGYIMLFSLLSEMLKTVVSGNAGLLLTGCTEVTNGIAALEKAGLPDNITCLVALFFLSLNGISGFFQTASILSGTDLSAKQYAAGKLLTAALVTAAAIILLLLGALV